MQAIAYGWLRRKTGYIRWRQSPTIQGATNEVRRHQTARCANILVQGGGYKKGQSRRIYVVDDARSFMVHIRLVCPFAHLLSLVGPAVTRTR